MRPVRGETTRKTPKTAPSARRWAGSARLTRRSPSAQADPPGRGGVWTAGTAAATGRTGSLRSAPSAAGRMTAERRQEAPSGRQAGSPAERGQGCLRLRGWGWGRPTADPGAGGGGQAATARGPGRAAGGGGVGSRRE